MHRAIVLSLTLVLSVLVVPEQALALAECGREADFDGDGRADLAVGVPGETGIAAADPGGVHVFYGTNSGLSASGDQLLYQGAGGLAGVAEAGERFGSAVATGDFDADGFTDLAIGVPGQGGDFEGAVQIVYGSAAGLTGDRDQIFDQNTSGMTDSAEEFDSFGASLAACDFDADGRDDLAIGVPTEDSKGAVHVMYGSGAGLTASGDQLLHQDVSGITDAAESGDGFGSSLDAGDFDADGRDDLAVGIPFEDIATSDEGAVHVIYGSSTGLSASGDQFWHANVSGIADSAESFDNFGTDVATGDFDGDARDDLAIGVPADTVVADREGAVHVLYGSSVGLTASGDQFLHQNVTGFAGTADEVDLFGFAVDAGDFDGDARDDLAVGVALEGEADGAVQAVYGSSAGLTASGDQIWSLGPLGFDPNPGAALGSAVGTGDFDGDGFSDLAAGAQGYDIPSPGGNDQGALLAVYGTGAGLSASGAQLWHQDVSGVADAAAPDSNQYFGGSLPGSRFNNLD